MRWGLRLSSWAQLAAIVAAAGLGAWGWHHWQGQRGLVALVEQNAELRRAIGNLTQESQIGYAKVTAQEVRDGRLVTRLKFVETHRTDPSRRLLEKEYEIAGDVVHFDALIVRFAAELIESGQARALYLWRRVYGETMTPEEGFAIEVPGDEPRRYTDLSKTLSLADRQRFWQTLWDLANEPQRLADKGITAIHGNVVYQRLRPGLLYVFKITNSGDVTVETVPDL